MVVFTCNHCGDTLQKPKVAKHYQFKCRSTPFLTCADCLKDFRGEEYIAHTKCITEAERYCGKDYVPKPSANKGERKQQEWLCVVNNLLSGTVELSTAEKNFLNILSKYENIPRKKTKFFNFIRNAMGSRMNMKVVESVWNKMETAHKQSKHPASQIQEDMPTLEQNNDKRKDIHYTDSNNSLDNQNIVENQNNENISRENDCTNHQNGNDKACVINDIHEKQKKSKKRKLKSINVQMPEEEQSAAKILKTSSLEANKNENDNIPFDWKETILGVVQAKGELSLRKLQNNIIKKYVYHIYNSHDIYNLTDVEHDKAIAKFNKTLRRLKKASAICVSEDTVKLP